MEDHRYGGSARPDLGRGWPSRLVATAITTCDRSLIIDVIARTVGAGKLRAFLVCALLLVALPPAAELRIVQSAMAKPFPSIGIPSWDVAIRPMPQIGSTSLRASYGSVTFETAKAELSVHPFETSRAGSEGSFTPTFARASAGIPRRRRGHDRS
jgi:hypothetical protein